MMNGDIPCNRRCNDRKCKYNTYGLCSDNSPCKPLDADGDKRKEDDND